MDHLALDVPLVKASPRLKDRVLGGIGVYRPRTFAGRLVNNRVFAAAAAFVLLAVAVGGLAWAVILSREVSQLRDDNTALAELTQLDPTSAPPCCSYAASSPAPRTSSSA